MIAIPFLAALGARLARILEARAADRASHLAEAAETLHDHVLIAGFGRVGQTVGRVLTVRGIPWIALDRGPRLVAEHRRQGRSGFYGDSARAGVLHASVADEGTAADITSDGTRHANAE